MKLVFLPLEEWWYKKREKKLLEKGWNIIVPGVYYKNGSFREYGISQSLREKEYKKVDPSIVKLNSVLNETSLITKEAFEYWLNKKKGNKE